MSFSVAVWKLAMRCQSTTSYMVEIAVNKYIHVVSDRQEQVNFVL